MTSGSATMRRAHHHEVAWAEVETVCVACFLGDGDLVLVVCSDGLRLPAGPVQEGEDILVDTVLRVPLEQAGFRRQGTHLVATSADGRHALFWVEGSRSCRPSDPAASEAPGWWAGEPSAGAELLRRQGRETDADQVELAAAARRQLSDSQFFEDSQRLLDAAYLTAETVQGGAGFGGSAADWRLARSMLCDAIEGDATFLDMGCANGLLMESIVCWSAERGHVVEPYGVDISEPLVELARRRLPQWQDRIWVGNALDWQHPEGQRFDVVHVLPELVPHHRLADMVEHLLQTAVEPGGRLLLSAYGVAEQERQAAAMLRRLGYRVDGITAAPQRGRPDDAPSAWTTRAWEDHRLRDRRPQPRGRD